MVSSGEQTGNRKTWATLVDVNAIVALLIPPLSPLIVTVFEESMVPLGTSIVWLVVLVALVVQGVVRRNKKGFARSRFESLLLGQIPFQPSAPTRILMVVPAMPVVSAPTAITPRSEPENSQPGASLFQIFARAMEQEIGGRGDSGRVTLVPIDSDISWIRTELKRAGVSAGSSHSDESLRQQYVEHFVKHNSGFGALVHVHINDHAYDSWASRLVTAWGETNEGAPIVVMKGRHTHALSTKNETWQEVDISTDDITVGKHAVSSVWSRVIHGMMDRGIQRSNAWARQARFLRVSVLASTLVVLVLGAAYAGTLWRRQHGRLSDQFRQFPAEVARASERTIVSTPARAYVEHLRSSLKSTMDSEVVAHVVLFKQKGNDLVEVSRTSSRPTNWEPTPFPLPARNGERASSVISCAVALNAWVLYAPGAEKAWRGISLDGSSYDERARNSCEYSQRFDPSADGRMILFCWPLKAGQDLTQGGACLELTANEGQIDVDNVGRVLLESGVRGLLHVSSILEMDFYDRESKLDESPAHGPGGEHLN